MEGSLMKWTNYLSGWQPRYFVLDGGILSYYDSQDDVGKGSKGSVKMAVCEIRVHQADSCRMDLFIPREQCFYLRAENAAERQRWLVALGSSKACLGDITTHQAKEMISDSESLGRKLSELRLFCDLLMEQVMEVKGAVDADDPIEPPNKEKLGAACSVLHGTCSHICSTLDDCMKYVNNLHPLIQSPPLPVLPEDVVGSKLPQSRKIKRSISQPAPQRTAASPRRSNGVTVVKNLEEMAMRVHSREQHYMTSGNGIVD
ncbi:pleckstrin homology domain-containing family A member 3-like [Rana temporaria]|uniref:pleckstrin homology domain-containing family A member 3-like n=1 Tax=Rana temporaria TaxID=8407 RepID=UPI001AAC9980|nr:pleckstrin homology domain-containing family A member 3-like [Rana temporaria]